MNEKILNVKDLEKMAYQTLEIPDFEDEGVLKVKVQKPRLLSMVKQGEIPNHLLGIANEMLMGEEKGTKKKQTAKDQLTRMSKMMELYSRACLVEPTYDEFKDYMTDKQGNKIFEYAIGMVTSLDSFRKDGEDDTDNSDGK